MPIVDLTPPSTEPPSASSEGEAVPFTPNTGPQTDAYTSSADVIGYGGSAGGGKSYLALALAATKHRKSLILRREKTQVLDLWTKLHELVEGQGRANETYHIVRSLPGDRSVELGGVKDAGDWRRYQGRQYDLHGFDEATEFLEAQIRTLIAWNRTTIPGQHCQVILTFNPPTSAEGEWVIRFFGPWLDPQHPNPAEPGELRYYVTLPGDEEEREWPDGDAFEARHPATGAAEIVTPKSRTFFPARVTDTPQLIASGYVATLQGLPEPLRSQMLYGDFTIGLEDDAWQVIPTAWVLAAQSRWRTRTRPDVTLSALGVDVAYGGRDEMVMAPRYGMWLDPLTTLPGAETPTGSDTAAKVVIALVERDAYRTEAAPIVVIDGSTWGSEAVVYLSQVPDLHVYNAIGARRSEAMDQKRQRRYANERAAFWWHMREILNPDAGLDIALPDDPRLRADLCAPRWELRAGGVIQIEAKEEIKTRLGRSPDRGDACVLAFAPVGGWDRTSSRPLSYGKAPVEQGRMPRAITYGQGGRGARGNGRATVRIGRR